MLENFTNSKQRYHSKTFKLVEQIALFQAICRLFPQAKINKACKSFAAIWRWRRILSFWAECVSTKRPNGLQGAAAAKKSIFWFMDTSLRSVWQGLCRYDKGFEILHFAMQSSVWQRFRLLLDNQNRYCKGLKALHQTSNALNLKQEFKHCSKFKMINKAKNSKNLRYTSNSWILRCAQYDKNFKFKATKFKRTHPNSSKRLEFKAIKKALLEKS